MPPEQRVEILVQESAVLKQNEQTNVENDRRYNSELGLPGSFVLLNVKRVQIIYRTGEKKKKNPNRVAPRVEHEGEKCKNKVPIVRLLCDVV